MRAADRGRGSSHLRSPGSRPSPIAGRSARTANRATGPASRCPLDPSLLEALAPASRRGAPGRRHAVPAPGPQRRTGRPQARRARLRRRRPPDRGLAGRPDGARRAWAPRPPRPVRPSPRRSSRVPRGAAPTGGPSPTMPLSAGSSSPGAASRPRRGTPAVPWPSCPCRRRRAGRSSTRASSPVAASPSCIRTWGHPSSSATRSSISATRRTRIRCGGWPSRSAPSPTTARSTPSAGTASRSADARATAAYGRSPPS